MTHEELQQLIRLGEGFTCEFKHIGSGIRRIRKLCAEYAVAEPQITVSEHWFTICFLRPEVEKKGVHDADILEVAGQSGTKSGLSRDQVEIMRKCMADSAISELMSVLGRTNRTKFRDQVLAPLLSAGLVEMTIPDKPRSSRQKYRLTEKGRKLAEMNKE